MSNHLLSASIFSTSATSSSASKPFLKAKPMLALTALLALAGCSNGQNETNESGDTFSMVDAVQAFGIDFLDETACRLWILKSLHGESAIQCPECGSELTEKGLQRFWSGCRKPIISIRTMNSWERPPITSHKRR